MKNFRMTNNKFSLIDNKDKDGNWIPPEYSEDVWCFCETHLYEFIGQPRSRMCQHYLFDSRLRSEGPCKKLAVWWLPFGGELAFCSKHMSETLKVEFKQNWFKLNYIYVLNQLQKEYKISTIL